MRTEYRYITQRDSVAVERWDTVRVEVKGDTVMVFEKLTEREYHYTYFRDTLRSSDTLRIEKNIIERPPCKRNGWKWMLAGLSVGAALAIVIRLLIKIYLKK